MPLPPDFEAQALYEPSAWFIEDVVELDPEARRVVVRVDTTKLGPLVDAQRPIGGHPKHFPGAIMIQLTGTIGQLLAMYCHDLKPTDGWIGFGTVIKRARFLKIGRIGPPVLATGTLTRARHFRGSWHLTAEFVYEQEGEAIYHSEQTATWFRNPER